MAVKETHSTCPSRKRRSLAFSGTEQQKPQRSSGTELQDKCVCLLNAQKVRAALNGLFVPLVFCGAFLAPFSPFLHTFSGAGRLFRAELWHLFFPPPPLLHSFYTSSYSPQSLGPVFGG